MQLPNLLGNQKIKLMETRNPSITKANYSHSSVNKIG